MTRWNEASCSAIDQSSISVWFRFANKLKLGGTIVVDVLLDHLDAEDEAQFRQRFQMNQMDYVRTEEIVEQAAQLI